MRRETVKSAPDAGAAFRQAGTQTAKGKSPSPRREIAPLTLRLTRAERQRLEELADGMTLSAYVRACVFAQDAKRRSAAPPDAAAHRKAIAEALALLGQSRIASNLNQLAYHANIGVLVEDEVTKAKITEANEHLQAIRTALMRGLGNGT